jgi:glyceraldehyde 3-phosphate dehydrogenase
MLTFGINGFGRIGRALFRLSLDTQRFRVAAINDIDGDLDNHAYLLKYDSTYGKLKRNKIVVESGGLIVDGAHHSFYCCPDISEVPWEKYGVDVVLDASGVFDNVKKAHALIGRGSVKKVIVTHAPSVGVDATIMVGVNDLSYQPSRHHVLSNSICDANAVAPFFKAIDDVFGIELAEVTTLHPWLQYQNLLDGTVQSVTNPGHFWTDYALGRSSVGSLIPKETTLVKALEQVIPGVSARMHATSYRTPTSIVSTADGVFLLARNTDIDEVNEALEAYCKDNPGVLHLDGSPLVSIDYAGTEYGAVVDTRWLHLSGGKLLKFVLWYDNEWGYASRALNLAAFATESDTNREG